MPEIVESYKNANYNAKIEEGQCYRCANRVEGNTLRCSKLEVIPKEILYNKKKCKLVRRKNSIFFNIH